MQATLVRTGKPLRLNAPQQFLARERVAIEEAWQDLHDAFSNVIESMQRKDYVQLAKGTEALRTSREELLMVAAALSILLEDSGLKDPESAERPAAS